MLGKLGLKRHSRKLSSSAPIHAKEMACFLKATTWAKCSPQQIPKRTTYEHGVKPQSSTATTQKPCLVVNPRISVLIMNSVHRDLVEQNFCCLRQCQAQTTLLLKRWNSAISDNKCTQAQFFSNARHENAFRYPSQKFSNGYRAMNVTFFMTAGICNSFRFKAADHVAG